MIKPDKYTDLKLSVLGLSYLILKEIDNRYTKIDKVFSSIATEIGQDSKYNFTNAINFLYMIGKIDYNVRRDSIKRGVGKVEDQ